MSVSLAVSSAALASSAAAQAAAQRAKEIACQSFVATYDAARAGVAEMQQYAECVRTLYPQPLTYGDTWIIKSFIVSAFIGAGVALYLGRDDFMFEDRGGKIMLFFLGLVGAPLLLGAGVLLCGLVVFLFS